MGAPFLLGEGEGGVFRDGRGVSLLPATMRGAVAAAATLVRVFFLVTEPSVAAVQFEALQRANPAPEAPLEPDDARRQAPPPSTPLGVICSPSTERPGGPKRPSYRTK